MIEILVVIGAVIVGVMSAARLTRLITQDSFPPVVWFRMKWDDRTDGSGWNILFHCHWCLSLWVTLPILLWGMLSGLDMWWWIFNGWLAAGYAAAMIVERDEVE
jgi:hypothetical protein